MTIFFPTELPQFFLREGFNAEMADGRLKTRMGSGHSKLRRFTANPVRPLSVQALFSIGQLARFWRFWHEDLSGGTQPFMIRDQQIDGRPLLDEDFVELTDEDGEPLLATAWQLCVFGDQSPTESALGGDLYRVSANLEILP